MMEGNEHLNLKLVASFVRYQLQLLNTSKVTGNASSLFVISFPGYME